MIYVVVVTNATRTAPVMESQDEYDDSMMMHDAWVGTNRERLIGLANSWVRNNPNEDHPYRIMIGEINREVRSTVTWTESDIVFTPARRGRQVIDNEETE